MLNTKQNKIPLHYLSAILLIQKLYIYYYFLLFKYYATIKITKTSSAEVTGSSTALEIYSEPLIRGVDAKVRLKVNNLGTSQMEFLTSENSGETKKVKVNLKDQDGNLLSTGYLNQRTGSMIVNIGSYAAARLNPNENIITEPIKLLVPESAPYRVIIEAVIENTYYHYGKPDQVIAPGMSQSIETTISETAYRAFASPEHTFYPYAQPVIISGKAISNQQSATDEIPMPYVPVKLGISVKGFDRFFTVTTDATGAFTYTFTPGANEAGLYTLWAVHPDIKDRAVQATFAIAGLSMSPETATVRMARNRTIDIPLNLYNYGGASLTGLMFETTAGTGITANVINGGDNLLTAGEQQGITLRITSSSTAPDTSYATMKAKVNEGLSKTLNANISIVKLIPVITTSPSYIDTGMVRGNQKIATFSISNAGEETLRNARIEGPSTSWMSLTVNRAIGDIQPGVSKTVGIMFSPPNTLSQGVYDDTVVIYSDNHIPYTYHIQVTVTSNAVGNVLFDVLNEFMEDVPNATITLQHQLLPELIYTLKTAADGTVMLYDIPEGRYTYNVSPPPGHMPYSGTFNIYPGITTTVPIALEMTMVTVSWSVTPTVIQDKYEIVVTQTFETNVPAPVLIVEPPNINLPNLAPGQVFNGEFKVTNYGLIEVYDVVLDFPRSIDDYDIEVMTSAIPNKIGAMKSITVPYRITRRITTASRTLYDEVMGYGGGNCVKNFNITIKGKCVICPNSAYARVVEKIATFILSIFYDCPGTITPSTPPTYVLPGGTAIYATSTPGQAGTGGIGGSSTTALPITDEPCNCKKNCTSCSTKSIENGVCVNQTCTQLVQKDPYDCKKEICDVDKGVISVNDDGETPPQNPQEDCKRYICENGQSTPKNKAYGELCTRDGNVCTDDYCDGNGLCIHPANSAPCDDDKYCTSYSGWLPGQDKCENTVCYGNCIADRQLAGVDFPVSFTIGPYDFIIIQVPGIDINHQLHAEATLTCCETQKKMAVNYSGFDTVTNKIGPFNLGVGLSDKLCKKASDLLKFLKDRLSCEARIYLVGTQEVKSSVSLNTDCCNNNTAWNGSATTNLIDSGIRGKITIKMGIPLVDANVQGTASMTSVMNFHDLDTEYYSIVNSINASACLKLAGISIVCPKVSDGPYGPFSGNGRMPNVCQ